jgi:hypothetical protein
MRFLPLFAAILSLAWTCIGDEDVRCGASKSILGSEPVTLYGTAGGEINILPIDFNTTSTKLQWIIKDGKETFVQQIYRRLRIRNVTGLAGESVRYTLTKSGKVVFTSEEATVRVGSFPTLSLNGSESGRIIGFKGNNVRVCFRYSGHPAPNLNLYRMVSGTRTMISLDSRFHLSKSCLEIEPLQLEDAGLYTLEAKNCFRTVEQQFRLKVFEKPTVSIDFQNATGFYHIDRTSVVVVNVSENGHLTLPYKFAGNPRPTRIEWSHNNKSIEVDKYNTSHLILHNVKLSDTGVYKLVVVNSVGAAQTSFLLSVQPESSGSKISVTNIVIDTPNATEREPTPVKTDHVNAIGFTRSPQTTTSVSKEPVPTVKVNNDAKDSSGFPLWTLGIIVGGTVVLIALIVLGFIWHRRGYKNSKRRESQGQVLEPSNDYV